MAEFKNSTFTNSAIKLDGNEYINCTFKKCEVIYAASGDVSLKGCKFFDTKFTFANSAQRTIQFMTALYHGGFKKIIEDTFENIRKGQHSSFMIH